MSWFPKKSNIGVGIDIGAQAVRLVQISRKNKTYHLDHISEVPLSEGAVIHAKIMDPQVVSRAISNARGHLSLTSKNVVIAVPGSLVLTKVIQLPVGLSTFDTEAQAWAQASRVFPHSLQELSLDFHILGPSKIHSNKIDILLVAVHSEDVNARLSVLEMAKIKPKIVEVDHFVLVHAVQAMLAEHKIDKALTVALAKFEKHSVKLVVMHDLDVIFMREINFSDEVSSQASSSLQEKLILHLDRAIQLFYSDSEHSDLQTLILSGSCSTLPGFRESVQKTFGMNTMLANPVAGMQLTSKSQVDTYKEALPTFLTAFGLAVRGADHGAY